MRAESRKTTSRRRKIWTVLGVAALATALAGSGALTTLSTSIAGNEFRSTVPDPESGTEGALLELHGDPIDADFDSGTFNHQVDATWDLINHGPSATTFDGRFVPLADIDEQFAEALLVQYGTTGEGGEDDTTWHDAGTVAAPLSYAEVTGVSSIEGFENRAVHVRVILQDPSLIASADPDQIGVPLTVRADFVVSYLDPLGSPRP